jgi:hypothetical protein
MVDKNADKREPAEKIEAQVAREGGRQRGSWGIHELMPENFSTAGAAASMRRTG